MYINHNQSVQVKCSNKLSRQFSSNKGVRQGDPLSPLLFNFYIDELFKYITPTADSPVVSDEKIQMLLFADDLVITSKSKDDLQACLDKLESFCLDFDMSLNTSKTKVVLFNKTGAKCKDNFTFNKEKITCAQQYKYLGIMFKSNGSLSDNVSYLAQKGQKAMFKLIKTLNNQWPSFNTSMHLFNSMIKPILTYGADVWGIYILNGKKVNFSKLLKNNLEKCQQKFLRYSIGLNKRTPIISLYGETGVYPLAIEILCQSMMFLTRLQNMPEDTLLYKCYHENLGLSIKNSMYSNIRILNPLCRFHRSMICNIKFNIQQQFRNYWYSELHNDSKTVNGNKLRHYRTFKDQFLKEPYLDTLVHKPYRSKMASLRLSSHTLAIETGRYTSKETRLDPEQRLCAKCDLNTCENEFHFIIQCPFYNTLREELMLEVKAKYNFIDDYSGSTLYHWLMGNNDPFVILHLSKYIYNAFQLRKNN
jgi:hypothetical protein